MNEVLSRWNALPAAEAIAAVLSCCRSTAWAKAMTSRRPFYGEAALLSAADEICRMLGPHDWMEAFSGHPRIGESPAQTPASARSVAWSRQEQQGVSDLEAAVQAALAEGNRAYEQRFGYIFIVCATGKSAAEILEILRRRMHNDSDTELREAAGQQRQITQLRLKKWLGI